MLIPSLAEAENLLTHAAALNPGPWVAHSRYVAQAAQAIAAHIPALDAETAYILGCLHDIGRQVGKTDMRHVLDGYYFLQEQGFTAAARICLTHSFPIPNAQMAAGQWDCTAAEWEFVQNYLSQVAYTDYDRLIQLCDALALPSGFCLMEKRLLDVALRHGVNSHMVARWQAYLGLQQQFDQMVGGSIYRLLPGVVENTFGWETAV